MKSRVDIISIDKNDTFENVVNVVIDSGFSRFPVYEEDLDSMISELLKENEVKVSVPKIRLIGKKKDAPKKKRLIKIHH